MNTRQRPPRIGGRDWAAARPHAIAVYNAGYSPSGTRLTIGDKRWTVVGPHLLWDTFPTHAEAIAHAFEQISAPDPTPQEQVSVTAGWSPKPDHAEAWKEKWELTR